MTKKSKFTFIDLFAGIGGMRQAFEVHGGKCVFSSEWDKFAQQTYEANFGDKPHGDITQIPSSVIPRHDILIAGFPCQPFSHAGLKKGFMDTRGTLFFDVARIINDRKPSLVLLENVKGFTSHDKGRTFATVVAALDELGYDTSSQVLNASDFGFNIQKMDVDFSRAIDRSREVADRMSNGVSFLFKKNKVQQVTGHGTVLSRSTVEVRDPNTNAITDTISCKNVIIATGARTRMFPFIEVDHKHVWTSTDANNIIRFNKNIKILMYQRNWSVILKKRA